MELNQTLRENRQKQGLTQQQLADRLFVSNKTISNWETGKTLPDIESLIRLANLFDLSLDTILLEGSDIVENIKKLEEAKGARKYFAISWINNAIFLLIISTQIYFGRLATGTSILIMTTMLLNIVLLRYFTKNLISTNKKTAYQIIKSKYPALFIPISLIFILILYTLIQWLA